jgi:hypothetical protein
MHKRLSSTTYCINALPSKAVLTLNVIQGNLTPCLSEKGWYQEAGMAGWITPAPALMGRWDGQEQWSALAISWSGGILSDK